MHHHVLEPQDQNVEYIETTLNLSIRDMKGEDADILVEDLSEKDKEHMLNFVKETLRGVHEMHENILVKDIKMEDGEFKMMIGNTLKDEDFNITSELINEYFMSETIQKKIPKIKETQYKVMIDIE